MTAKSSKSADRDAEVFSEDREDQRDDSTIERNGRHADDQAGDNRASDDRASDDRVSDDSAADQGGEGGDDLDPEAGSGGSDNLDDPQKRRRRRRRRKPAGGGRPGQAEPRPAAREGSGPPQRSRRGGSTRNGRDRGPSSGQRGGQGGQGGQRDRGAPRERDLENAPVTGTAEGVLELHPKGYGFLRDPKNNYAAGKSDPFVPGSLIEKWNLREGVLLRGDVCAGTKGQGARLKTIESVDGRTLEEYHKIKPFDELTAINPFEQIKLETGPTPITMRVMDLLTPIGKGQRALIVAPPRTGKTMLLQEIANAVSTNHPEVHLMVLLIDERPEEVTELRRRVRGEVIASSMDRDVESHVRLSQLIIERGKRIAEAGGEVFILLDSITRTARAFNKWVRNSGAIGTGGLDIRALDIPKKMFGTARRFDEGGSLTVVATALIDTGSRMDEIIFQEFKGTGNMEMVLNRQLADRRIWPSIDITQSGTRREEKILPPDELEGITMLRRSLISLNPIEAMEQLIKTLARFPSNKEFLAKVRSIL